MQWDDRYAEPAFAYGTDPNAFLAAHAGELPVGRTLCLAEGQGRNAVHLATLGHDVTAVDRSAVGMRRAQELAGSRGTSITTIVADLAQFRIAPASWTGIVSIFAHLPAPLRAEVHRGVVEGLAPGGVYLLEAYAPAQLRYGTGGPKDAALLASLDTLLGELAGLDIVHARETERDVVEGTYHTGRAAVVQVIARRR
jgi:SAM-dependent methyltransferase